MRLITAREDANDGKMRVLNRLLSPKATNAAIKHTVDDIELASALSKKGARKKKLGMWQQQPKRLLC
jgi:hypothetical protein